jgi:plasmid stabilization system protein ParE
MAYAVEITLRAERDLAVAGPGRSRPQCEPSKAGGLLRCAGVTQCSLPSAHSYSGAARKWYLGLRDAILSLKENPNRCPRTPENPRLRHLPHGHKAYVCRVICRVEDKQARITVLRIRHGGRKAVGSHE